MVKQLSRPKRWAAAIEKAQAAMSDLQSAVEAVNAAREELKEMQDEYADWQSNLPESLQSSPVAEKLDAVCGIDLESDLDVVDDPDWISEAEGADLPLGFGKD